MSCATFTYFSSTPDFLTQYHYLVTLSELHLRVLHLQTPLLHPWLCSHPSPLLDLQSHPADHSPMLPGYVFFCHYFALSSLFQINHPAENLIYLCASSSTPLCHPLFLPLKICIHHSPLPSDLLHSSPWHHTHPSLPHQPCSLHQHGH